MAINNLIITSNKFKFTHANLKSLPSNPANSSSTELKLNDFQRVLGSVSIDVIG